MIKGEQTDLKLLLEDIQAVEVFGADVMKAMENITRCYKEIVRVGKSCDSFCLSVFNCLRSTKKQYLQGIH